MRRFAVAMKISRRNDHKPPKKATMAATKKSATGTEASKPTKAPTNRVAMTAHTNSAVTVQSVIARLMSRARRERALTPAWIAGAATERDTADIWLRS